LPASVKLLAGEIEADETFAGGKQRREMFTNAIGWKRLKHGPGTGKATVFGMVQTWQR
jgi:hypothetical protein